MIEHILSQRGAMFFFMSLWCFTVVLLCIRIEQNKKLKEELRYATFVTDYDDTEDRWED